MGRSGKKEAQQEEIENEVVNKNKVMGLILGDLGIKNNRLRGLARILLGSMFTVVGFILFVILLIIVNALPSTQGNEGNPAGIMIIVAWIIPFISAAYILMGLVELLTGQLFDRANAIVKNVIMLFLGIPFGFFLVFSFFKYLDRIRNLF